MWAGAPWNVEFLVYGALMVSSGLFFWQAVWATLVGNIFSAVFGIASLPGPETDTTAFMVRRAPFRRNGNRAPSLFNWITQVGFAIEGTAIIVVTLQAIGIPLKRWGCVLIDTVISGGVTALVIFKGNFYRDLSGFLDYIVVWLGPWFGILLVDYLISRGRYDVLSLAEKRGAFYWRKVALTGRRSWPWRPACSRQ